MTDPTPNTTLAAQSGNDAPLAPAGERGAGNGGEPRAARPASSLQRPRRLVDLETGEIFELDPARLPAAHRRATNAQLSFIHARAREAGLTRDALRSFISTTFGVTNPEELSRAEASRVIDMLAPAAAARRADATGIAAEDVPF